MKQNTILIVDDSPENIDILNAIIAPHYRTLSAKDGFHALRIARSDHPPDLILLDIFMPEMDGFQVVDQLKKDPDCKDIPVILVTGSYNKETIREAFEIGAQDYVTKPVNPIELMARVSRHLELTEQRRQLRILNKSLEIKIEERTKALRQALKIKETLLREMHHRILNNLQILKSLLSLQMNLPGSRNTLKAMQDYLGRIQTMAIVHKMIQSEQDLIGIDLNIFLQTLFESTLGSVEIDPGKVNIKLNANCIKLNANIAIPCGLIFHELLVKILESEKKIPNKVRISVECVRNTEGQITLYAIHHGKALQGFQREDQNDFNFILIHYLAKQLNGSVRYNGRNRQFSLAFTTPVIKTFNPLP